MSDGGRLAEFLRARRELVTPAELGLSVGGTRRVPGLRREEVALLAGISSDYYLRLEQGRDRNPSAQVLESLARVLQLDADATAYLLSLVASAPRRRPQRTRPEMAPVGVRMLVDTLGLPAFVEGQWFDVLAANALARALSPSLEPGRNRLRDVFLDEGERALYPDWERATARLVAGFRESVGDAVDDPRVVQLVGELSLSSERFRRLWARHDVAPRVGMATRVDHPHVGEMTLRREKLAIGGTSGQMLVVYHADPGTESAQRLATLAVLAPSAPAPLPGS